MMWQTVLIVSIVMIVFLLLMAILYSFINMKNVKRQKEHFKQLHQNLEVGKQVICLNGIYGTLIKVGNETVDVKVKSGAVMEVSRYAITEIVGSGNQAS